jgi:hypothetical protein
MLHDRLDQPDAGTAILRGGIMEDKPHMKLVMAVVADGL